MATENKTFEKLAESIDALIDAKIELKFANCFSPGDAVCSHRITAALRAYDVAKQLLLDRLMDFKGDKK